MRFKSWPFGALLGIVGGIAVSPAPTRADNNITYNFNETNGTEVGWFTDTTGTAPLWDWNTGPSVIGGGWQAFSGTNSANSATYLTSPCFIIDNNLDWVNFKIANRFYFPLSGTSANQLGQVQYRVDTGSGWGAWSGIPTQFFVKPNGNPEPGAVLPNYGPPLFPPLVETSGTLPVQAWSGTTLNFATGFHEPSEFTLFFDDFNLQNGYDIQFRFAMATDTAVSGTDTVVWEVNSVQIEGVVPCAIPEPGTLALAGMGGLSFLLVTLLRRRPRVASTARAFAGSTAVTIVVAAAAIGLLAAAPARAQTSWNFELSNGGWVQTGSSSSFPFVPAQNRWMWTGTVTPNPLTGGTSPHWHILAQGVQPPTSSAFFLTSPVFSGLSGTTPAQNARISIAHDFFFATGTSGRPVTTGQLQYRLNDSGPWIGLPLDAFTDGGSVLVNDDLFGPSPFKETPTTFKLVDQSDYVAPTYLTPTGTAALPFVSADAASFLGATPLWPGDYYVPSQAFLNANTGLPAIGITSLQLRFTNLNLAANCVNDDGWNVRFVQVDFDTSIPPVPEPATFALGATGLAVLVAAGAMRRRRTHQRPSRPSDRP